ncbi:MAG: hypothetical protein MJ134_07680 [Lachnospiraceae bacterium]|nr:hypothetical protein [Lachnospiraceae bacterium]
MSEEEIAREYRMAKHKERQIKILAELNGCAETEIQEILVEKGEMKMPRTKVAKVLEEVMKQTEEERKEVEAKKVVKKQSIPDAVIRCVKDRMQQIEQTIKRCEEEYKDLADFIKKGVAVNE